MPFPCTSCGACCRRAGNLIPDWPWLAEDGKTCTKLTPDNQCSIYKDRPLICRVDGMIEYLGLTPKETWYNITASICNKHQEEDGMDKSYMVKVDPTL